MPPLPKRKISKARRNQRRSHHALSVASLVSCPHCHELRLSHRVCPHCGYYKGIEIMETGSR